MSIWNRWNEAASRYAHDVDRSINPDYRRKQERIEKEALTLQLLSNVGKLVSVVALFFGIAKSNFSIILVSGFLGYFSTNMYQVGKNYEKVAKNPHNFDIPFEWVDRLRGQKSDNPKLKKHLEQNTFCFGIFVDLMMKHCINLKNK